MANKRKQKPAVSIPVISASTTPAPATSTPASQSASTAASTPQPSSSATRLIPNGVAAALVALIPLLFLIVKLGQWAEAPKAASIPVICLEAPSSFERVDFPQSEGVNCLKVKLPADGYTGWIQTPFGTDYWVNDPGEKTRILQVKFWDGTEHTFTSKNDARWFGPKRGVFKLRGSGQVLIYIWPQKR